MHAHKEKNIQSKHVTRGSLCLPIIFRIDSKGNIKVADFGLAEDVYTTGYFRENDGGVKLPFKWMAPESLTDGVFTEKTDVVRLDMYLP